MELSCRAGRTSVHLLAYLHDESDPDLRAEVSRSRASRERRAEVMVERIGRDHDLVWDDVRRHVTPGATVGRPHIADALVGKGLFRSRDEVFATVLADGSPYYVAHYAPDVVDAVRLVRRAGGVPVMAHPRAAARGRVVPDVVIEEMAAAGLAGLEVHHRDHDAAARRHLLDLAGALGLLVTGSSDWHGSGKANRLGECTTDPHVLAAIEAQASGTAVVR
jgi:3',5'-nucleoside bisphosphate phosphatase